MEGSEMISGDMAEKLEEEEMKMEVAAETVQLKDKQPTWSLPRRLDNNKASVSLTPLRDQEECLP